MTEAMAKLHSRITRLEAQEIFLVEHDNEINPDEWHTQQIQPKPAGDATIDQVQVQRNAAGAYTVTASNSADAMRRGEMAFKQQRDATVQLMDTDHISDVGGRNNGSREAYEHIHKSIRNHSGSSSHSLPNYSHSPSVSSDGSSRSPIGGLQDRDSSTGYPLVSPSKQARILDGYSRPPNVSASDAGRHPKVSAPNLYPARRNSIEPPVPKYDYVMPGPNLPGPNHYGYRGFPF